MRSAPARRRAAARLMLAISAALAAGACGLIAGIDKLEFVPECTADTGCDDHDPCTLDTCDVDGGVCAHTQAAYGTLCSDFNFCDDQGRCVQCVSAFDCPIAGDDCQQPTCLPDHTCGTIFTEVGTPTITFPPQTPGDCQVFLCDGAGGVITAPDDGDLPDDADDCTADLCGDGIASHMQLPPGTPCGTAELACDIAGKCMGCSNDAQCTPPYQTCGGGGTPAACGCTPKTCADLGAKCGHPPDGCGGTLACDNLMLDPPETDVDCGGGCAPCAKGKKCSTPSDCAAGLACADGVCCDNACSGACVACNLAGLVGTCSPIPEGMPDVAGGCAMPKLCNGFGKCRDPNGTPCALPTDCASNACTDGVCCESTCTLTCRSCTVAGSVGKCANVPKYSGDDTCTTAGMTCNGGGACLKAVGQPCTAAAQCASGVCSGNVCKLAFGDTCTLASECVTNACSGTCRYANGVACVANGDCASGRCADNVCCNSFCNTQCHACNLAGNVGSCTLVPAGTPDVACAAGSCAADGGCM